MNRILALIWKELRLFVADPKSMMITFLVPIGIASFFASIFSAGGGSGQPTTKISVLVVDNDQSELTGKIIDALNSDSLAAPTQCSEKEADEQVKSGKAGVAVIFPKGFGEEAPKAMFNGKAPQVELRYDPGHSMEMQAVQGSIMQTAMKEVSAAAFSTQQDYASQIDDIDASKSLSQSQKQAFHAFFTDLKKIGNIPNANDQQGAAGGMRQPFELKAVPQTASQNEGKDAERKATRAHTFAGMAVQGVLFFGIEIAMGLMRDRRLGIWRRLRAAPVSLGQLLVGKALASSLIATFVLGGVLAFGIVVFGIRPEGSWPGLILVTLCTATMVASFGLLVASLGRTEQQSRGLSVLAVLTMVMLGGGWFPSFMMPQWVQTISLAVPVRWALDGFDGMLWRGNDFASVLPSLGGLIAFTAAFGIVAAWRFRTTQETA